MALDSLSGYSAIIDNASSSAQADKAKTTINSVASSAADSTDKTEEEKKAQSDQLMGACKQFESYLWEQVYKEMKKTSITFGDDSSSDYGMNMVNLFMDSTIEEISSESVTEGPNSLAQSLYDQLKRNYNIED